LNQKYLNQNTKCVGIKFGHFYVIIAVVLGKRRREKSTLRKKVQRIGKLSI
jgi:hypothetical protein